MNEAIKLDLGKVKSFKADLVRKEIRLVIAFRLDDELLSLRESIGELVESDTPVDVTVSPRKKQMRLSDAP